jgi:hypothetical protein
MKTLRVLIFRVAERVAIALAVIAVWFIVARLGILGVVTARNDGCIFQKAPSQWSKDDLDLLHRRILRLQAMPEGKGATRP